MMDKSVAVARWRFPTAKARLVALAVATTVVASARADDHRTREALRRGRVPLRTLVINEGDVALFDGQVQALPLVRWSRAQPLRVGELAMDITTEFRPSAPHHAASAISRLSRYCGATVIRSGRAVALRYRPRAPSPQAQCTASLRHLFELRDAGWTSDREVQVRQQVGRLSAPLQTATAVLLSALLDAHQMCASELASLGIEDHRRLVSFLERYLYNQQTALEEGIAKDRQDEYRELRDCLAGFDHRIVCGAAQNVIHAAQLVLPLIQHAARQPDGGSLDVQTPLGRVVVGNTGNDRYDGRPAVLVIDLGGNDHYGAAGQNHWPLQAVSMSIDVEGNDTYSAAEPSTHSFGAGMCGIGLLFDLKGDDRYRAADQSQGFAVLGVGLLYDAAGDDQYLARAGGQGAAVAGQALLIDLAGHDRYRITTAGQGHAGPSAAAALVDMHGNDEYEAGDEGKTYPSYQSPRHTACYAQGCGRGIRADRRYGHGAAGGIGLLYDASGDDHYRAEVFGQGVGYWHGLGLLIDAAGSDCYEGHQHVQGAGVHFSAGALVDHAGDDHYHVSGKNACGSAHDLSVGVLEDHSGNDTYPAADLALGASVHAGVALCIDHAGDDDYQSVGRMSLGSCAPPSRTMRRAMHGAGVFIDLSGRDIYPGGDAANDSVWQDGSREDEAIAFLGRGVDLNSNPGNSPVDAPAQPVP